MGGGILIDEKLIARYPGPRKLDEPVTARTTTEFRIPGSHKKDTMLTRSYEHARDTVRNDVTRRDTCCPSMALQSLVVHHLSIRRRRGCLVYRTLDFDSHQSMLL